MIYWPKLEERLGCEAPSSLPSPPRWTHHRLGGFFNHSIILESPKIGYTTSHNGILKLSSSPTHHHHGCCLWCCESACFRTSRSKAKWRSQGLNIRIRNESNWNCEKTVQYPVLHSRDDISRL